MNDLQLLLAEVIKNPDDDTLRMAYADELEERGYRERSEFIRVGLELAKWPERLVVKDLVVLNSRGPNYWTGMHQAFEVGMRVDLLKVSIGLRSKNTKLYGLKIIKEFSPEEADKTATVGDYDSVLVADEMSVKEPDHIAQLRERHKEMVGHTSIGNKVKLKPEWFSRGFLGRLECTAKDFLAVADSIIWHPEQNRPCPKNVHPIRKVVLTTLPPLDNCGGVAGKWWLEYSRERWPGVEFELPQDVLVT